MATNLVVDSSVFAALFLLETELDLAERLIEAASEGRFTLYAPSLVYHEVRSVLSQNLDKTTALENFEEFDQMVESKTITIYNERHLTEEIFDIAYSAPKGKGHVSSYDSTYHALAIELNAVFVTLDKSHYNKTHQQIGHIILLTDLNL